MEKIAKAYVSLRETILVRKNCKRLIKSKELTSKEKLELKGDLVYLRKREQALKLYIKENKDKVS